MAAENYPFIPLAYYLAQERLSSEKHEYFDGLVYMMAGASERHVRITGSIARLLGNQLVARPCSTYSSDLRVKTPSGLIAYPDVIVVCGEPQLYDEFGDVLLNPTVLFEVLSPTTQAYDRTRKFEHYRSLPTLREYVLVAQDQPLLQRYLQGESGEWALTTAAALDQALALPSIGCTLALAEVYANVSF